MANNASSRLNQSESIVITIKIVPLEEEEDDFDTLSAVEEIVSEVKNEAVTLEGYSVVPITTGRHGGEVIQLISQFVQNVNDNKELLASLGALSAVIRMIKKWRRVKKMELTWGSKTLLIEDADSAIVDTLIKRVEGLVSDEATVAEPIFELKAEVSKHSEPEK